MALSGHLCASGGSSEERTNFEVSGDFYISANSFL
jgi:hypothetical protein